MLNTCTDNSQPKKAENVSTSISETEGCGFVDSTLPLNFTALLSPFKSNNSLQHQILCKVVCVNVSCAC